MTVAILALQGAFAEHQQMLGRMGVQSVLIRQLNDWTRYLETSDTTDDTPARKALIIPGGESTTMLRLLRDLGLFEPIRKAIAGGMPVFGTCAGLIMLDGAHLATMDIEVRRNAYGRQLGSFHTVAEVKGLGPVPMTFIRAPYITAVGPEVEVLATVDDHIVAARQGKQLVTAFHPELDDRTDLHALFLSMTQGE